LGKVCVGLVTGLIITPVISLAIEPVDTASQALGVEGGKEVVHSALKIARSRPSLALASVITCMACAPVAGVAVSPALCITCGILIAKTLG
jgi:hypothetical protein